LQDLFNTPLLEEAYEHYCELDIYLQSIVQTNEADKWTYIWRDGNYSSKKCYNHLLGSQTAHPTIKWLWNSRCQAKHKVFYWLLLHNRLNTRGILRRKNMNLESYTCDLYILQKAEKLRHLFYRCSFAKQCMLQIGIIVPTSLKPDRATRYIKRKLRIPFAMEIIILMCWNIWIERNIWVFDSVDPTVQNCKATFKREFTLLWHKVKEDHVLATQSWLNSIN
jgi:hypothetical protein